MKEYNQPTTINHKGKKITNNTQTHQITINNEPYTDYCIIATTPDKIITRKGNTITSIPRNTTELNEIIKALEQTPKEKNKTKKETTQKTTKKETNKTTKGGQ